MIVLLALVYTYISWFDLFAFLYIFATCVLFFLSWHYWIVAENFFFFFCRGEISYCISWTLLTFSNLEINCVWYIYLYNSDMLNNTQKHSLPKDVCFLSIYIMDHIWTHDSIFMWLWLYLEKLIRYDSAMAIKNQRKSVSLLHVELEVLFWKMKNMFEYSHFSALKLIPRISYRWLNTHERGQGFQQSQKSY